MLWRHHRRSLYRARGAEAEAVHVITAGLDGAHGPGAAQKRADASFRPPVEVEPLRAAAALGGAEAVEQFDDDGRDAALLQTVRGVAGVYASRPPLPSAMQDSLPAGRLRLCRAGVEPAGSLRTVSVRVSPPFDSHPPFRGLPDASWSHSRRKFFELADIAANPRSSHRDHGV